MDKKNGISRRDFISRVTAYLTIAGSGLPVGAGQASTEIITPKFVAGSLMDGEGFYTPLGKAAYRFAQIAWYVNQPPGSQLELSRNSHYIDPPNLIRGLRRQRALLKELPPECMECILDHRGKYLSEIAQTYFMQSNNCMPEGLGLARSIPEAVAHMQAGLDKAADIYRMSDGEFAKYSAKLKQQWDTPPPAMASSQSHATSASQSPVKIGFSTKPHGEKSTFKIKAKAKNPQASWMEPVAVKRVERSLREADWTDVVTAPSDPSPKGK